MVFSGYTPTQLIQPLSIHVRAKYSKDKVAAVKATHCTYSEVRLKIAMKTTGAYMYSDDQAT